MPYLALLHPLQNIGWTTFTVHPSTVLGLAALAGLYEWGARTLGRPRSQQPSPLRRACFYGALLTMFLSLNGPLHDLSDFYLFSGHMVQHLLLTLLVPPLLLWGVPGWMLRPLLRHQAIARAAYRVTRANWAFAIFNVVVAAWHVPALYNTAMTHHWVHIVQHLLFMATAVLMWWPLLSPLPELPRLPYPGQMLYCFLMAIPMSIVAVYISMAERVLYPAYAAAPRLWGITPMEDQLIGGLIMWVPGGLFFVGVMSVVFFQWSKHQEDSTSAAQVA